MGNFFSSMGNLFAGDINGLGKPANVSFFGVVGEALWGCLVALLDGIMFLIYIIMKFVLNIVDFLQFFVKKLMGLDYWGKGTASIDTLDDSDVIFRFLKDENVMQVFKYMIGVFIVLLIVFTIIAIIKTEWAYASSSADSNSKGSILNRSLKACMLVVLLPILIIMGILASNAILTSLVNAFNINNNLTLGGQVFTASAYDANKYRQYAKNNIRLGVTSNIMVTANNKDNVSETILVPAAVTAIIPMKYKTDSKFTGICFLYEGKEYLYYVEKNELENHYRHYIKYIDDILDATIITASQLSVDTAVSGENKTIEAALHPLDSDHRLVQAAYNTWGYNELFTRDTLTFDKTVDPTQYSFSSDTGHTFADARIYTNASNWGRFYDGGTNGLVVIPDEYYVMADVIDFMISQGVEMSFVNIANPLINWTYVGTGTYLNGKFVRGITSSGYPTEFLVNYAESGYTAYIPNRAATSEEKGAIYIMAYYNAATSRYIPVVNNKTYVDDQGNKHTFKSSSLDVKYEGLIVARGVLDSTFKNRVGQPTQITTDYSDGSGNSVGIDTPYYMQLQANEVKSWASVGATVNAGLSGSFAGLTLTNGNIAGKLTNESAGGLSSLLSSGVVLPGVSKSTHGAALNKLAESLPTKLDFVALDEGGVTATTTMSNLVWSCKSSPVISVSAADGRASTNFIVFSANQTVRVHVDNKVLSGGSGGNRYNLDYKMQDVTLYCLVALNDTQATTIFAYGQRNDDDLLNSATSLKQVGDGIYGDWSSRSNTLLARVLAIGNITFVAPNANEDLNNGTYIDSDIPLSVVARLGTEFGFASEMEELGTEGSALSNTTQLSRIDSLINVNYTKADTTTETNNHVFTFTKMSREILMLRPEITGAILDGSVSVDGHGATGTFAEHAGTREVFDSYTYYYFGWQQGGTSTIDDVKINVRVKVDSSNVVTILVYDMYKLNVTNYHGSGQHTLKVGGKTLQISAYDMEYVTTFNGNINTYRYEVSNNQYFYFNFRETGGKLNPISTGEANVQVMYKIYVRYYNLFSYRIGDTIKQYDPTSKNVGSGSALKSESYYLRPSSIVFGRAINETTDGEFKIYEGMLYKEDNSESTTKMGSVITSFNLSYDKDLIPSDNIPDAIKQANSISGTSGKFSRVPDYGNDSLAESLFSERKPHIQFFRHSFVKGCVRFDFSFNPLKLFGEGNLWRFKLAFLSGVSNLEEKTLKFTITNGRLYLDYNFNSVKHLTLNTFFMPSKLNVVVLVFASILLFSVLGQAVWGLVARIYDIVLYFIIMPAVVSSTVIQSDSKIYNNWQSSLISKVMGSYGVLMGINFFFLLVPAIKEASQLFTDHDLATNISQGSWLSFMTADAVNNLVYILFLLVAFTIIKTLPGTIGNLIGLKKGDEAYSAGASVKKSVDSVISDVSHHVSGASLLEAQHKLFSQDSKDPGLFKQFTPGSAIYDKWKAKHPKKSREEIAVEKDAAEKRRGADIARQKAEAQQQLAQQQMEAGNAQRNAQRPGDEQSETRTDVNNIPANDVDEVRTATPDLDGTHESSAGTHPDVENAVDENTTQTAVQNEAQNAVQNEAQNATRAAAQNAVENAVQGDGGAAYAASAAASAAAAQNAVENAVQGDGGAAAYAASAAASAAAAQAYADIASGNTAGYAQRADAEAAAQKQAEKEQAAAQKQAEKEQKEAEKAERANETRDERKLRELKEELAEAESDTKIAPWKIEQAFETFNKNKALEDQVIESMTYYNSNFDERVMELAKQEDISVAKAQKAVKNELAVAHWNKTHKDNQITTESLANDAKLKREVNNEFKDHQSRLQATAKNELITNKIQEKINKQETKMELKARGLYQNPLQKALANNPILRKTTDKDRIRLNRDNENAKSELAHLQKVREQMVTTGKGYANKNKEIEKLIKQEEAKLTAAQNLIKKKDEEIKNGTGGSKSKQIKNKAIQDMNKAQNHIDALRGQMAHNQELMTTKAKQLVEQDAKISSTKDKIARYEQALDGNYQGFMAGLARRTANGGRYVKAGTHLAAQRIAEGLANSTAKSVEKKEEKKVKSEHSSNDNEKFTESQIRNLDKKMGSVKATNAALENYARSHGFDVSSLKDKNNQTKNITKKDMKDILDAQMKKELGRNAHSEANVIRAQYAEMQKEVDKLFVQKDKAIDNYNQAKREFNRQNHNSFVRRDTRLGQKQVAAAQIAKSRLISEMNDKNRKGIMTPAEEKEYVRRIQSYDQAIADSTERRVAYHKMRKQITDTKLGRKFVSARGVVNEKTAPAREFVKKSATAVKGWVGTAKDVTKAVKTTISESAAVAKKIAKYAAGQTSFYTKMAATAVKDFATERALDVKDATYGRYKRAKNTKAYMASAEHAQNRQSYIAKNAGRLEARKNRDIYAAESIRRTGQAILQQQLDKKFVNRIKSDLAKSGLAGNIPKVTNRSAAEAYAMKISPKQNTMESAIHKAINNQMKNIVDGVVKATDKMPKAYLHKADSPTLQSALNRSANFHRALKAVESRLKKELRESTKFDSAKGIADELSKVQYQLKSLKTLEERTKRQVARLNSTMKKIERDKKSEKYKIKGIDKSSDATKK